MNLFEYGLGGDPTNGYADGHRPTLKPGGSGLMYIHVQRNDDTNLTYSLELTPELSSGIWSNSGYTVTGTNTAFGGSFDEVTNAIPASDPEAFIRLIIGYP